MERKGKYSPKKNEDPVGRLKYENHPKSPIVSLSSELNANNSGCSNTPKNIRKNTRKFKI